jgi:hypothetical protein
LAHGKALRQAPQQRAGVGKRGLQRSKPRAAVDILEAHAARIVEQHREHVSLAHGAREHYGGTQQAGEDEQDAGGANRRQHDPIAPAHRLHPTIQDDHHRDGGNGREQDEQRRHDGGKDKIAALEDARRILEEEGDDGLEHSSQTDSLMRGTGGSGGLAARPGRVHLLPTIYAARCRMVRHSPHGK